MQLHVKKKSDRNQKMSTFCPPQEVNAAAIRSLAELTARSIELFHKLGEGLLLSNGDAEVHILSQ